MSIFYSQALTTKVQDIEKWRSLVGRIHPGDIYFSPEYALAFEKADDEVRKDFGGEAQLFFYGNNENYIVYPFFKRNINELLFCKLFHLTAKDWFDIISPYGYSGPIAHLSNMEIEDALWAGFFRKFHCYCLENNIVSEFVRLHPYIKNHLFFHRFFETDTTSNTEVVYIELGQDESLIKKNMDKGHRSSISKAQRSGVEFCCSKNSDDIESFSRLYAGTMERNKAKKAYFFSRKFFGKLFSLLGDKAELFIARYQGQIIAGSIFLFQGDFAHYFLSGSDAQFLHLCPNNLILYEASRWAKRHGYKILDLGGGYEKGDGLSRFKRAFSRTTAEFYTYKKVHCKEIYEILCQAKDKYDRSNSKEIAAFDYFPHYRR